MSTDVLKCERHGTATRLTCAECGKPICPKCSVRTEVGLKCEEHARAPAVPVQIPGRSRLARPALLGGAVLILVALVLVFRPGRTKQAERPLPPVGSWSALATPTNIRGTATATALKDGTVLVAGGGVQAVPLSFAEIFDPKAGTWTPTGELNEARRGHQAVLLQDGRVLIGGGIAGGELLASAEIYDPASRGWKSIPPMTSPRLGHSLTLLADGKVLAAGGSTPQAAQGTCGGQTLRPDASAEIFDPARETWTPAGTMATSRFEHTATALEDGRVLIAGGTGGTGSELRPLASTELYDPASSTFTASGRLGEGRTNHAAARLKDGTVLVAGGAGGADCDITLASSEVFEPQAGGWSSAGHLAQARTGLTLSPLPDGRAVAAAGESATRGTRRSLATAELWEKTRWRGAGRKMGCPRSEQAAAVLPDGSVLVVAGDAVAPSRAAQAQSCAERYVP